MIHVEERKEMVVYVKLDEYKDIVDIINLSREKLNQAKSIIAKVKDLKKREDEAIGQWVSALQEVEEKINIIDRKLLEPQV